MDFNIPIFLIYREKEKGYRPDSKMYITTEKEYKALLDVFEVHRYECLPDKKETIIQIIHNLKDKNIGLIEAEVGKTNNGISYAYCITKSRDLDNGNYGPQIYYFATISFDTGDKCYLFKFQFAENGVSGIRDAMVYGMNKFATKDNWIKDPYDETFKEGFLMNQSEERKYDSLFPCHPLSKLREAIEYIISNN